MCSQILFQIKLLHVGEKMTEEVKNICHMKAKVYENYVKYGRSDVDKKELVRVTSLSSDTIIKAREICLY